MATNFRVKDEYATFESTTGVVQKKPVSFSWKAKAVLFGFLLLAIGALVGLKAGQALAEPMQLTDVAEGESFGFGASNACAGVSCTVDGEVCNPQTGICGVQTSSGFRSEAHQASAEAQQVTDVAEGESFGFGASNACAGVSCPVDGEVCNPQTGICGVQTSSGFRSEAHQASAEAQQVTEQRGRFTSVLAGHRIDLSKCAGVSCTVAGEVCNPQTGICGVQTSSGFRSEAHVAVAEGESFGFGASNACAGVSCTVAGEVCNPQTGICGVQTSSGFRSEAHVAVAEVDCTADDDCDTTAKEICLPTKKCGSFGFGGVISPGANMMMSSGF